MFYRTLVLLAFMAYMAHSDPIYFEAYMRCEEPGITWCGQLIIYEEDDLTSHDIMQNVTFCTNTIEKLYQFPPSYPGDDFGQEYEFNYQLRHNCTSDGQIRCLQPKRGLDVIQVGARPAYFYIKPRNAGTIGCRNIGLGPSEVDED